MQSYTTSDIVAFLSMLVALAAVVVGPIVSFKLARRQLVLPIRQKWIDDLRDLMSTLLSKCRAAVIMNEGNGLLDKREPDEPLLNDILFLEQKLQLMLNPREDDHQKLIEHVDKITEAVQHGASNLLEFGQRMKDASACSKSILKREWERVKNGES
ncbi:hypothetical protein [Roseateles sp. P5_D6]